MWGSRDHGGSISDFGRANDIFTNDENIPWQQGLRDSMVSSRPSLCFLSDVFFEVLTKAFSYPLFFATVPFQIPSKRSCKPLIEQSMCNCDQQPPNLKRIKWFSRSGVSSSLSGAVHFPTGVKQAVSTIDSFGVLTKDGYVASWGGPVDDKESNEQRCYPKGRTGVSGGCDTGTGRDNLHQARRQNVVGCTSIIDYGDTDAIIRGGGAVSLFTTDFAFAALLKDGTVHYWVRGATGFFVVSQCFVSAYFPLFEI